jgi:hypothetical protein
MKRYVPTKQQREQIRLSLRDLKNGRKLRLSGKPTVKKILAEGRKKELLPR